MFGPLSNWFSGLLNVKQVNVLSAKAEVICPGCASGTALAAAKFSEVDETYKSEPYTIKDDSTILILVRCYCYSLAFIYFCISYRLRQGLARLRFNDRAVRTQVEMEGDQDIHLL